MLDKHLKVKKSTLPGAGKGLFTKVDIPKGTRITEYKGRRVTWNEVKDDDGKNKYLFYINSKNVINAEPYKKSLARYANDAKGLGRVKGINNNSDYVIDGKRVFIEAVKDIPAGAEILVDYGKEYWQVIKDNLKIDEKKKKKSGKKSR